MSLNLLVSTKIIGHQGLSKTLLRDWRIVCLEENGANITFLDLFDGILTHQFDKEDTFVLPPEFINKTVTCELAPTKVSSDFQQVPLHVKVADATTIVGIYIRYSLC